MGAVIAKHNSKVLKNAQNDTTPPPPSCNCQIKEECPVPGACNQSGVIYMTKMKSEGRGDEYLCGRSKKIQK